LPEAPWRVRLIREGREGRAPYGHTGPILSRLPLPVGVRIPQRAQAEEDEATHIAEARLKVVGNNMHLKPGSVDER